MKRLVTACCIFLQAGFLFAQGIAFDTTSSWPQVLARAEREHRYIFVDAYTTWCAPCKAMDKQVYMNDSVGAFFNEQFICVKIQMDSTGRDNSYVRRWYDDARMIARQYKINAFPTLLFFNPKGELVQQEVGFKGVQEFTAMAATALEPGRRYQSPYALFDSLLAAYRQGKKDYQRLPYLIRTARETGDTLLATQLTGELRDHLKKIPSSQLYDTVFIGFLAADVQRASDPFFPLFYPDGTRVDRLMQRRHYARTVVDRVIRREFTSPALKRYEGAAEVNWDSLRKAIANKYPADYADRAVAAGKTRWYEYYNRPGEHARAFMYLVDTYGEESLDIFPSLKIAPADLPLFSIDGALNAFCYGWLFQQRTDPLELDFGVRHMKGVAERSPRLGHYWALSTHDTYANLLYKTGRREEAIRIQRKAVEYAVLQNEQPLLDDVRATLRKMENNIPTWTTSKPPLDAEAIAQWETVGGPGGQLISGDGRFFCYLKTRQALGTQTMVIQRLADSAVIRLDAATPAFFSRLDNQLLFTVGDTLFAFHCHHWTKSIVAIGKAVQWSTGNGGEWISWQNDSGQLLITNYVTKSRYTIDHVNSASFEASGAVVLIRGENIPGDERTATLQVFDLATRQRQTVWRNQDFSRHRLQGVTVARDGRQLTFMTSVDSSDRKCQVIWHYRQGTNTAQIAVDERNSSFPQGFILAANFAGITPNGRYIHFAVERRVGTRADTLAQVDVWSYHDTVIQSAQLKNPSPRTFSAVVAVGSAHIILLESDTTVLATYPYQSTGDFIVTKTYTGDRFWEDEFSGAGKTRFYLTSLQTGERSVLAGSGFYSFYFSPGGGMLLYFNDNGQRSDYWSLDLATRKVSCLTAKLPGDQFVSPNILFERNPPAGMPNSNTPFIGWMPDGQRALVYDQRDVWLLDLEGKAPICVTNGYGRNHNIIFEVLQTQDGHVKFFNKKDQLLLAAFDKNNFDNGFYTGHASRAADPALLYMGPRNMHLSYSRMLPPNAPCFDCDLEPLKAARAKRWIIRSSSATDAPNFFITTDFRQFTRLTNVQPQAGYNWYITESAKFAQRDGVATTGILYKPANFDPAKKYPVIIYYYQHLAHRVNQFLTPGWCAGAIDIPWFVSHGYLVFTPDIHFTGGQYTASGLAAVEGAADYLSTLSYVDTTKIGINGHSLGGFITNYIVTHSQRFACALSGAGVSDFISASLSLGGINNGSRLDISERRLGVTMSDRPDIFLDHSPVYHAKEVTTPVLLFHCKADYAVPFQQAIELFTLLRRMQKPVWLLQYDKGDHELNEPIDQQDYTNRVTQFFDHYLKGKPAPKWMTNGIPGYQKGVERGY